MLSNIHQPRDRSWPTVTERTERSSVVERSAKKKTPLSIVSLAPPLAMSSGALGVRPLVPPRVLRERFEEPPECRRNANGSHSEGKVIGSSCALFAVAPTEAGG